jgi:hypothetical protein
MLCVAILYMIKLSNPSVKHVRDTRFGSIRCEICMILLDNLPLLLPTVIGTRPTISVTRPIVAGTRPIVACNRPFIVCTRPTVACTRPIVTYETNLSYQLSVDVCDKSVGYY